MTVALGVTLLSALGTGCGPELDVGSDLLFTARFEGNNFDEWTGVAGGNAQAFPAGNTIEVSTVRAHHGAFAAKLTINAGPDGVQQNAGLSLAGGLPTEAYYSAWFYLTTSVNVGTFWVIFKFQMESQATGNQLYDLDLINLPSGEMTLMLYDHRIGGSVPLDLKDQVVPVGQWFQIEAFYRNAQDTTGRVTYWLDGRQIVDIAGQAMAPTSWVEWDAVSVGVNLTPSLTVLYVDDCAVSRTRVGPAGIIAR